MSDQANIRPQGATEAAPLVVQPAPLFSGVSSTRRGNFMHRPKGFDAWQLLFGLEGRGELTYPGGKKMLQPNELFLFAPGAEQRYGNPGPRRWRHLFFVFHAAPHWQRWLTWPEITPGIGFLRPRTGLAAIRNALHQSVRLSQGVHRFGQELAMDFLHQALIHCQAEHLSGEIREVDSRITRWIEEVGADLKKSHLPIREMARHIGMSPSQLARAFHRQLGLSPVQYFEKLRMEHAAELLTVSSMRVREIAEATGYEDALYFSGRFRAAMGLSPRQWRQKREKPVFPPVLVYPAEVSPDRHFEGARLEEACRLLSEGVLAIPRIARSLGYEDQAEFSFRFRAVMGVSPLEYRRRQKK